MKQLDDIFMVKILVNLYLFFDFIKFIFGMIWI